MALYQRIEIVEARQYEGPRLTVVSDAKGEQTANAGDWLIGTEPHKVTVMSDAEFSAGFKLVPDTETEQN